MTAPEFSADDVAATWQQDRPYRVNPTEMDVLVAGYLRLLDERDAAYSVIRRYRDGWRTLLHRPASGDPALRIWARDEDDDEVPVNPAEAAVIRRAVDHTGQDQGDG